MAAGQGPVAACLKRVKRTLKVEAEDESFSYFPCEVLEQERDMLFGSTVVAYRMCEIAREAQQKAIEARERLAEKRCARLTALHAPLAPRPSFESTGG